MEIEALRYFLAAAREANITRAAEALHVAQPTLSKVIKSLERELGRRLFVRERAGIRLTDAGELLRRRAEDIVEMADKTAEEFAGMDDELGGDIRIGSAESRGVSRLAAIVREIRAEHPRVRAHIYSGDTEGIAGRLDRGIFDFALICQRPDLTKYDALRMPGADRWVAIMRGDHPLAARESVTPDDLRGVPILCSRQAMREDMPRWFGAALRDVELAATFDLAFNEGIFAREGIGVALCFGGIVEITPSGGLVSRPLSPALETAMYVISRRGRALSPAASLLLARMRERFAPVAEGAGHPGETPGARD